MFSVSAIPRGPLLGKVPVSGLPGDRVNVTCSVLGSLPAPSRTWSVVSVFSVLCQTLVLLSRGFFFELVKNNVLSIKQDLTFAIKTE